MTELQSEILRLRKMGIHNNHLIARMIGCSPSHVNYFVAAQRSKDRKTTYYQVPDKVLAECRCPRCRVIHEKMIQKGDDKRQFCETCRRVANSYYAEDLAYVDTRAIHAYGLNGGGGR